MQPSFPFQSPATLLKELCESSLVKEAADDSPLKILAENHIRDKTRALPRKKRALITNVSQAQEDPPASDLSWLKDELGKLGIHHIRYYGHTEKRLILEIAPSLPGTNQPDEMRSAHMLLEVKNPQTEEELEFSPVRIRCDMLIQPAYTLSMALLRAEIFPKVRKAEPTQEHIQALQIALAKKGLIFCSPSPKYIRFLEDGTPIVNNKTAVRHAKDKDEAEIQSLLALPDSAYDWEGKTQALIDNVKAALPGIAKRVTELDEVIVKQRTQRSI